MSLVLDILFFAAAAVVSLFLRRQVAKHQLRIGRISPLQLALYDFHYSGELFEGTYHFTFTASHLSLQFHWPCRPNPKLVTFTATGVLYKSTTADISTSSLSTVLWFFPVLFRQTAGPWVNVELDDFRIRVFSSDSTPSFVKALRENLVGSLLGGEILRLDDFGTNVRASGVTESAVQSEEDPDGDGTNEYPGANRCTVPKGGSYLEQLGEHNGVAAESVANDDGTFKAVTDDAKKMKPVSSLGREQDEVRISAYARGVMIHNKEGRMYTFGALDAQLRRSWIANSGNFVLIAKEGRWVRVPCWYQMQPPPPLWSHLLSALSRFPCDLVNVYRHPVKTINLHIPRVDVTFDNFRLRDAELVMQAISMTGEKFANSDIRWQDLFVDVIANAVVSSLRS